MPTGRLGADEFARQYAALRRIEGWIKPDGSENPVTGDATLWRGRLSLVNAAAAVIEREREARGRRLVIADVGSGGAWLADYLPGAHVVSIDLLPTASVRGDMRKLPLAKSSLDAVMYIASLHYAELHETIPEAARVLVEGGLFIALDSPVYQDEGSRRKAAERSAAYYHGRGYPDLAMHYHPIDEGSFRAALAAAALVVQHFQVKGQSRGLRWRLRTGPPSCFVVARRLP